MHDVLAFKTGFVIAAFALLFALERLRPAAIAQAGTKTRARLIRNLSFWPLNAGLSLVFVLPFSAWAGDHALWVRLHGLSGPGGLALDILALDLFLYGWHRAMHEAAPLWRFHEVHHLDRHLDTTSALRFHSAEILFSAFPRALVIAALSIPFSSVAVFESLVLAFTFFHHSNVRLPPLLERALSAIIVTPSIHWVHHHALRCDTDSNYGTLFSFWDRLFASRSARARTPGMAIGVEGIAADMPFPKLLVRPFEPRGTPKIISQTGKENRS